VTVGTPLHRRLYNATTDFRGINQRMHNKTFIVDGRVAITGGRNMADEYFDFDHEYNFRDRDALLLGAVAAAMETSFEDYWNSHWSVPVAELYGGLGLMHKRVGIQEDEMQRVYQELHTYAASPENFAPAVHTAIAGMPTLFPQLAPQLVWGDVEFIADRPGKNSNRLSLGGGGLTTLALARLVESARTSIVIQSPYLVLSDAALALFRRARERGVRIRVSTNSLASTDNLQAFSGYRNQRARLLDLGLEIHEFRPDPLVQKQLMPVATGTSRHAPVFALHAKTLVVDSAVVVVGTYNLDPRSENLNTEVGVIVRNAALARQVEAAIERDMQAGNSWDAARDDPDRFASFAKRSKTRFWQLLPVKPLL
jgi:putative cardiolipin synthase